MDKQDKALSSDREFLNWLADRLVYVYKEPANIDFVLELRRLADSPQLPVAQMRDDVAEEAKRMQWVLRQIVSALPSNKDWLDPALEREANQWGDAELASQLSNAVQDVNASLLDICRDELKRSKVTSLPQKIALANSLGLSSQQIDEWMRNTRDRFVAAVESAATVPQVVQAPILSHETLCSYMPPGLMFGDSLQPHHMRDIIDAVRADTTSIVTTVPSEQIKVIALSKADGEYVLKQHGYASYTLMVIAKDGSITKGDLLYAAPSTAEQASDVRKPLLTECPECNGKGGHIVAEYCDNGIVQEGELCQMCKGLCIVPTHELSAHTTTSNAGEAKQGEES